MLFTQFLFDSSLQLKDKAQARAVAQAQKANWCSRIKWQIWNIMRPTYHCPNPPAEGSPAYEKAMRYTEFLNMLEAAKV